MFSNIFNSLKDITDNNNLDNNNEINRLNDLNNNSNNNSNNELVKYNKNNDNNNDNNDNNEKLGGLLSLMKNITNDTLDGRNLNSIHNNLGIKYDELIIEIHNQKNKHQLPTTVHNTYNTYNNYGTNNYSNNYNLNGGNGKKTHKHVNYNKTNAKDMIKNKDNNDNTNNNKKQINANYKGKEKQNHTTKSYTNKSSALKKSNKKLYTYNKEKKLIILDLFNKYRLNNNYNDITDIMNIMNSNMSNKVNNEKKNVKLYLVNEENVCITIPKIYLDDLYNPFKDILLKCISYSLCSIKININTDTEKTVIDSFIKDKKNYLDNIQSNLKDIKFEIYNKILYNKELTILEKKKRVNDFNNRY
jgi:hypothetical protein